MRLSIDGIHHVTAISGPAQQNVNFYVGVLGLRLVKRTVNFDDPRTYHLYYGDEEGRPGTIMTFFPWEHALPGRAGKGMVTTTAFSIPPGGVERWMEVFADRAIDFGTPFERFGSRVLPVTDPDGLRIELVEDGKEADDERAIASFSSITLCGDDPERTARFLIDVFGYRDAGDDEGRLRFEAESEAPGRAIELYCRPDDDLGRMSTGVVHHVAFRVETEDEQETWRENLLELGYQVSEVRDRQYFKSIYFREPGGVLFEIATDSPGFQVDEMPERLGSVLKLPPWIEPRRPELEQHLPPITIPK